MDKVREIKEVEKKITKDKANKEHLQQDIVITYSSGDPLLWIKNSTEDKNNNHITPRFRHSG